MKKIEDDKQLSIDNIELRNLNTKKIMSTVEEVGSFVKTARKEKKIAIVSGLVILCLIVFLVLGSYLYMFFKSDGEFLGTLFNLDSVTKRYVCWNEEYNTTFRDAKKAIEFKELFEDVDCIFYSTKVGG